MPLEFQRRSDGWPLCPCCGEDELFSTYEPTLDGDHTLVDYLLPELSCYRCGLVVPPAAALVGFMSPGGQA